MEALLPPSTAPSPLSKQMESAFRNWLSLRGSTPPQGSDACSQRAWDDLICRAAFDNLIARANQVSRARLLASSFPSSGAWLNALPCRNLGLALSDREFRVAVGLRLGVSLVRPHTCGCGANVDPLAYHDLSCRLSAGRQRHHALAN